MAENRKTKGPDKTPDGDTVIRTEGRDFRVEGNDVDGYIGVSSEYRGYANETDRPYVTEEDIALLEKGGIPTDVEAMTLANAKRPKAPQADSSTEEESDADEKKDDKSIEKKDETPKAPVKSTPAKAAPAAADSPKDAS